VVSYFDSVRRYSVPATAHADTLAFEANHQFTLTPAQRLSWGAGFQHSRTQAIGRPGHNYDPAVRRLRHGSLTLADEITLQPDRLSLTLGAKAEYNPFTHWEALPTGRLAWTPSSRVTGWLALSRGVQTPGLSDFDLTLDIPGVPRIIALPSRDRPAGNVVASEAGWRWEAAGAVAVDLSLFHHAYSRHVSTASTFDARTNTLVTRLENELFGETRGGELAVTWDPRPRWRMRASYSALRMDLNVHRGDATGANRQEGISPRTQWQVMSMVNVGTDWDLSAWLRRSAPRRAIGIPAYWGLDLRVAYRAGVEWEVAVVGKDLADSRHPEFSRSAGFPAISEIPRSVLLEVKWTR
jgi:iron complex outermembrane receptor protein